jgi:transposase InsO family protein
MANEVTAMDIKMLVATLPADANMSAWCRQLGISRETAYKWRRRLREEGVDGLEDRSRAPRHPFGKSDPALEDAIVATRKQLAEEGWDSGPASIRDRLLVVNGTAPSESTIWRISVRRGQVTPQPKKRPRASWHRFQRDRPNECWQGDDTHYLLATGQEVRIINLLDDHSRLNVDGLAVAHCRSARIWESFCRAVERYGLPAEFLSDNGRAWRSYEGHAPVVFQANLVRVGVHHIHSSPYHPQTCGKVERFHQTQRRWLDMHPVAVTIAELQALLDTFREGYNHRRPHRAIARRTPAAVWAAQPPAAPARSAEESPATIAACHVDHRGRINAGNKLAIGLGVEWALRAVTVIRRGDSAVVIDTRTGEIVRELIVDPTRHYQGTGLPRSRRPSPRD